MDLEIEFRDGVSLRRQLEDALRVAIRSGRLLPGSVLPPSRDLADQLSVSRGVVVDSYAQLATEGYLSARRGSCTRVAATAASGRPPARRQLPPPQLYRYELRPGTADFHSFPRAAWKADLAPPLRTSASRASPVQVLIVGQTSSNRSKTTPISSENVKPIAMH